MFKDYDKNIVFMDCQMHFLNIYLRRKEIILIFFRHFVELSDKNQPLLTTFETLAEIERGCMERQLSMGDFKYTCGYVDERVTE